VSNDDWLLVHYHSCLYITKHVMIDYTQIVTFSTSTRDRRNETFHRCTDTAV